MSRHREIKVLYLDDQEYQLEFAKIFLEKFDDNIKIEGVTSPYTALQRLMAEDFDVVVSDYMMDEMTGIEFAEKLREFSDLPVILYTGYGSEEIAESAFASGVDDYIKKESGPGHFRVLLNRIMGLAEKRLIEQLYKKMVESSRDGIFIVSEDEIVFANPSLLDLLGCEDLQCQLLKNLGKEISEKISESFGAITNGELYKLFEVEVINLKGKRVSCEASVNSIYYYDTPSLVCYLRNKHQIVG